MGMETFSRSQLQQELNLRCFKLAANNNRGFKQEFGELHNVGRDLPARAGVLEPNKEKNRYSCILPYDHCRVRLSIQNLDPHSDYINANFVPGGGSERDFICTQGPLPNTIADFWRMVWEQNVRIIVMVTALRYKDTILCDKYWMMDEGTAYHGSLQVTTVARKQGPDYFITTVNLRQRDSPIDRIITHYQYPSWPDCGVPNPSSLCAFTEHIRQHLEAIPRLGPAVVHCSAGVGRSGTFVALLWMMQLCVRGITPDIKAAVKDLRLHRMWTVQTLEQYMCVHQCLVYWLSGGSSLSPQTHSNYQPLSSSGREDRSGRRRRHQRQKSTSEQQNSLQIFNPGNLLRRLMPSLSQPGDGTNDRNQRQSSRTHSRFLIPGTC
ncbi:receptor-type tyrosine-protein phosphatase beta [Austrofundulus limnaeus]|uniref:protein-tyrosine-phosphatase n=1 Tax=Austrofundulus limnaeus TaxID=52670 RepID=A0A2I4BVD3_AUSLI|nr:PREDICTED: receptor-type tyrosine-protein phosphatase beta-like [Austrofundulus limnaeus]XP_013871716.1 PREDICTED: receptor-type tyrosine-protein phosphatase beta-like [Austrofundulus limnaeus]